MMTVDETIKVLSKLSAFYGEPKSDAREMAMGWHIVLKDYDFAYVDMAVIQFAMNDTRDYATFPTVGKFIQSIEHVKSTPYRLIGKARKKIPYDSLETLEKRIIGRKAYDRMLDMDDVKLVEQVPTIVSYIQDKQLLTETKGSGENDIV